jgi:hypothetical protein
MVDGVQDTLGPNLVGVYLRGSLDRIGDADAAWWARLAARSPRIARRILSERYGPDIGPDLADLCAELARLWLDSGAPPAFEVGLLRIQINDRWMRESCPLSSEPGCDREACDYKLCRSADLPIG